MKRAVAASKKGKAVRLWEPAPGVLEMGGGGCGGRAGSACFPGDRVWVSLGADWV